MKKKKQPEKLVQLSRRRVLLASSAVVAGCGRTRLIDYEDSPGDVSVPAEAAPGVPSLPEAAFTWPVTLPEWPDDPTTDPAAGWEGSDDVAANNIGDPLILTAEVLLQPGAAGSPNSASLSNPYKLPMELLEMRFSIAPITTDDSSFRTITGLGIGVKGDLGSISVIDTDVPLSCFSSYRDATDPIQHSALEIASSGVFTLINTYSWRLKYPLYIPGGSTLNLSFHHFSQEPVPAKIWVTYHCRVRPKGYKPTKLMVPWVCSYNSKAFNVVASEPADSDESSELDLINPFSEPLEVTRFVGSYSGLVLGTGTSVNAASEVTNPAQPRQYTYVNITSSQGDDVVFTPTLFEALWPNAWRVWDLPDGIQIDPSHWFKVTLTRPAIDYDPLTGTSGTATFGVSMIGYREVGAAEFSASLPGGA